MATASAKPSPTAPGQYASLPKVVADHLRGRASGEVLARLVEPDAQRQGVQGAGYAVEPPRREHGSDLIAMPMRLAGLHPR